MKINSDPGIVPVVQPVTVSEHSSPQSVEQVDQGELDGFEKILKAALRNEQLASVSEEELFAGLVEEGVADLKGDEALAQYKACFDEELQNLRQPNGFVSYEDLAKAALRRLRDQGVVSSEEADNLYSKAFAGAQLDDNLNALYDGIGGPNDPTRAVAALEQALLGVRVKIQEIDSNEEKLATRSLDEASNTKSGAGAAAAIQKQSSGLGLGSVPQGTIAPHGAFIDGPDGFLFKPISENEKKLAVLLPEAISREIESIVLKDSSGNVVEEGKFTSFGETGTRAKFAFNKEGGAYPNDLTVEVRLSDGDVMSYAIPDPSKRYD